MLLKRLILFLFCVFSAYYGFTQNNNGYAQPRILILLDRSSSMIMPWDGGRQKSKVGDELILKLMDSVYSVNNEVEFSLRVFGHMYTADEKNCHDTRNEVPFHRDNRLQMQYRLEDIKPLGVTSIAYSLQEAALNDLVDVAHNAYSIILVTDGGESCGGDICEVMRRLIQNKVYFKPYIVSLEGTPGLKAAYDCMGNYLEVTKQGDINRAVGTIVEAFTPILKLKSAEYTTIKNVSAKSPTMLGVNIPVVNITDTVKTTVTVPANPTIDRLQPTFKNLKISVPKLPVASAVSVAGLFPEPKEGEDEPLPKTEVLYVGLAAMSPIPVAPPVLKRPSEVIPPAFTPVVNDIALPEPIARTPIAGIKLVDIKPPKLKATKEINMLPFASVIIIEERPEPEFIARLQPARLRTFNIIFVIDENDTKFPYRKPPPMPPLKFDPVPVSNAAKVTTKSPDGKTMEYVVETEEAKETTVELYFTDGKGKFYPSTPQVILLDPKTSKMVKRFYRMVNADGDPDPQTDILPGTYLLTFTEMRSLIVPNIKVEANKKNKITVTVEKASLSFEYANDISRPITEFSAIVIERNKPTGGRIVNQKCTEKLEYEPGNYFVEINTFPKDKRNLDLDFGEKIIKIPQPGFAKFISGDGVNSVTLYERLGDKFLSFHTMSTYDPSAQHLRIQPGEYQAHYRKGPGGSASEKVVTFIVKATEEVVVELK